MTRLNPATALLLAAALMAGGCAPLNGGRTQPDNTATATLPVTLAGINDQRAGFAALLAQELAQQKTPASDVWTWLHPVDKRAVDGHVPAGLEQRWRERAASTAVLIVPGFLGDCVAHQSLPFGDGVPRPAERGRTEAYANYSDLGLHSIQVLALPGRARSAANGELIAQALRSQAEVPGVQRIVVVAYSKGMTDMLYALEVMATSGGVPEALRAVVSVAGVVMGSPLAPQFAALYQHLSPLLELFDCSASDGNELEDMQPATRAGWLGAHPPARSLSYYSITAFAAPDEVSPALKPMYSMLGGPESRTDGQLLASDTVLPGSVLLAQVRSDHWDLALPLDRHPNPLIRTLAVGRSFPREALFRASLRWVISDSP